MPEEPGADPEPDQGALDDEPDAREPSGADELMKLGSAPLSRPPRAGGRGRGRDSAGDVGICDDRGFPDEPWDDAVLADAGDVPLVPGGLRPWQRYDVSANALRTTEPRGPNWEDVVYRTTYDKTNGRFLSISDRWVISCNTATTTRP